MKESSIVKSKTFIKAPSAMIPRSGLISVLVLTLSILVTSCFQIVPKRYYSHYQQALQEKQSDTMLGVYFPIDSNECADEKTIAREIIILDSANLCGRIAFPFYDKNNKLIQKKDELLQFIETEPESFRQKINWCYYSHAHDSIVTYSLYTKAVQHYFTNRIRIAKSKLKYLPNAENQPLLVTKAGAFKNCYLYYTKLPLSDFDLKKDNDFICNYTLFLKTGKHIHYGNSRKNTCR